MKVFTRGLCFGLVLAMAMPLIADENVVIGFGRDREMGGAGLALPLAVNYDLNPALFAYGAHNFHWDTFQLGYHTSGASLKDLYDTFKDSKGSKLSDTQIISIAKKFGTHTVEFGALGNLGFNVGSFFITGGAEAMTKFIPNQQLASGLALSNPVLPLGSQEDGYGYGYYHVNAGTGQVFNLNFGTMPVKVAAGFDVKVIRAYYSHLYADATQIIAGSGINAGLEMNGQSSISKSGFGADAGVQAALGQSGKQFVGLSISNLIVPRVGFPGTLPSDLTQNVVGETYFNPFHRAINLGYGMSLPQNDGYVAVDYADFTNSAGTKELRIGAVKQFGNMLNVSAGYGTRNGFSAGISLYGISLGIDNRGIMTLQRVFSF